jgi:predicted O-methyltransferase YrrM
MNQTQYLQQNAIGFEGDTILAETVKNLFEKHGITWVIETGTFRGATTKRMSEWCDRIDTIEVDATNYAYAKKELESRDNVTIHHGSSDVVLETILSAYKKRGARPNLFCFLDAHWQEHNPLLNELEILAKYKWKPVILIHDFKVPGRPELGFDQYGEIVYEWDWIKESIEKIYGVDGFDFWYNQEATGAKRGVIILSPKYKPTAE